MASCLSLNTARSYSVRCARIFGSIVAPCRGLHESETRRGSHAHAHSNVYRPATTTTRLLLPTDAERRRGGQASRQSTAHPRDHRARGQLAQSLIRAPPDPVKYLDRYPKDTPLLWSEVRQLIARRRSCPPIA